MGTLFCLDVELIEYKGEFYTTGAANYDYFKSFIIDNNSQLTIFCRKKTVSSIDSSMAKASGEGLKIIAINSYLDLFKPKIKKTFINLIINNNFYIIKQPAFIGLFACYLLKKNNRKYIVNMVGCPWDSLINRGLVSKIIAPLMYFTTRHYVKNASAVIYVSNIFLQKRYPTKGKQIGCSDVLIENNNDEILKTRLDKIKSLETPFNLTVGTIGAINVNYKGQKYVINAISKLKKYGYNIKYQLVGNGDKSKLEKLAQKKGVIDNVFFLGCLPHDKIFEWITSIDLYIQPSEVEGLCRSIIEAMSMGCPIIASNAGGNPELINKNYIFKKRNVKHIIKIIQEMTSEKMIESAKENYQNSKRYNRYELLKSKLIFLRSIASENNI